MMNTSLEEKSKQQESNLETREFERPPKRQKCLLSFGTFDEPDFLPASVFDMIDAGIAAYNCDEHERAEEQFSKVLKHCSVLSNQAFVELENASKSAATMLNKKRKHDGCSFEAEYDDEGMRAYRRPIHLKQGFENDPGILAATLCFNIAQTYVERALFDRAIAWFHRSLDIISIHSRDQESILAIKNLHGLGYCHYRLQNHIQAKSSYERALSIVASFKQVTTTKQLHLAASLNCVGVLILNEGILSKPRGDEVLTNFHHSIHLLMSYRKKEEEEEESHVSVATVLNNIGRIHFLTSDYLEASVIFEQCLKLRRKQCNKFQAIGLGTVLCNLGLTYYELNRFDDSLSCYNEVLRIIKMSCQLSSSPRLQRFMFFAHKGIGNICFSKGDFQMAMVHFNQARIECHRHCLGRDEKIEDKVVPTIDAASLLNQMGSSSYRLHNLKAAIVYYDEAYKIEMETLGPCHRYTIITLTNLLHIFYEAGEYKKALEFFESLDEAQLLQKTNEASESIGTIVSDMLASIGYIQYQKRNYESSLKSYQEALRIRRQIDDSEDGIQSSLEIASILHSIGNVWFHMCRYELAIEYFDESVRTKSKVLGDDYHYDVVTTWYNIAITYVQLGENDIAHNIFERTLQQMELNSNDHDLIIALQHVAQVYHNLGHVEDSIHYLKRSLKIVERRLVQANLPVSRCSQDDVSYYHRRKVFLLNLLGNTYLRLGMTTEMMQCFIAASRMTIHADDNVSLGDGELPSVVVKRVGYIFYNFSKTNPPGASTA